MRWMAAAAVCMMLAGCGPGDPGGSAGRSVDAVAEALDDTEWMLVEGVPLVEDHPITLRGEDGRIGGTAACNRYGAEVSVSGDHLEISELASTEMACPEPGVHDSEGAYLDALRTVERYERTDEQLILSGPDVELHFEPATPVGDAPLTGTGRQLESLLTGTGSEATASSVGDDRGLEYRAP